MTVYETAKEHFYTLTRMSTRLLPIKTDNDKIIYSPTIKGLATTYFGMLLNAIKKEHGN